MVFWQILKVAFRSLLANKLRSVLAMLGIIIGVAAVIAMLAIGSGAQQQVMQRINNMGTNLVIIRPGQRGAGGVVSGTQQNMTVDDAIAILKVPGVSAASPVVSGNEQVKYMSANARTNVMGVAATYFGIRNYDLDRGALFSDADTETRLGRVAVIGPVTATNLFGDNDPIGQTVKVNGINFVIVGTFKSKGDTGWFNADDQILIPYRTAIKELFGVSSTVPNAIREIDVEAQDGTDMDDLVNNLQLTMRTQHRLQPDAPDDVEIRSQAEFLQTAQQFAMTFTILLGSVAGISLLVGGIGIMNIMLVTVTERTREIGIRKAIGARDSDILNQFLIESIIMSGIGGLLGVATGIGVARLIAVFSPFPSLVKAGSVLISLFFSAAVGIFFGYYPATRAAKLDPIEALRYE